MPLTTNLYNFEGKTEEKITLPKEFFGAEINNQLLAQSVRVYLSNQRKAKAQAKTRGEVIGSTRKIYRQKGTGKARHGDLKAPIFVGGGKAHGPTGEQNYKQSLSQKMRQVALASALSSKFNHNQFYCFDGTEKIKGKTKEIEKLVRSLPANPKKDKFLLVLPARSETIKRAVRNYERFSITDVKNLSVYQILNCGILVFTKEALKNLNAKRSA